MTVFETTSCPPPDTSVLDALAAHAAASQAAEAAPSGRLAGMRLRPPECVNLEPPTPDDGSPRDFTGLRSDTLSTSAIGTLLACQQKWYWSRERRLEPAVKSPGLEMGSGFADALEHGDPNVAWDKIMGRWHRLNEEFGGNPWVVVPSQEAAEVQAQIAREAARAYLVTHGRRERREHSMRARLRNPATGYYSRTFDLLCRVDGLDLDAGVLIEDKLVGRVRTAAEMQRRLSLDRQVSMNVYLVWRTTGVLVREVRYRVTRRPGIERRKGRRLRDGTRSGAETHAEYLQRIAKEYLARTDEYIYEFICRRTHDDMLRLEAELWRWAEVVRDARRDGVWPRNTGACEEFAGCQFLGLCAGEPGAMHSFVERRWPQVRPASTPVVAPAAA